GLRAAPSAAQGRTGTGRRRRARARAAESHRAGPVVTAGAHRAPDRSVWRPGPAGGRRQRHAPRGRHANPLLLVARGPPSGRVTGTRLRARTATLPRRTVAAEDPSPPRARD